jgi:hypothetical protein
MRLRTVLLVAALAAVSFMGLSIGSPAAQAHDSGPPNLCIGEISTSWGYTCFEIHGDDQWVYDRSSNGWGVRVQVEVPEDNKVRWCVQSHGFGFWHQCNYDHWEDRCVFFRMFEQKGDSTRNWTGWSGPWPTGNNVICIGEAEQLSSDLQPATAH